MVPPAQGQPVSVAAFGAKGDGKSDDTQAVLKAVSFVTAQPKPPRLVFSAGTFLLSAPLLVDTFVAEGAGPNSTELVFSQTGASSKASSGYAVVVGRAANSRGPGGPTWDPLAPRRGPLGPSPDRESPIDNAPALVPGTLTVSPTADH